MPAPLLHPATPSELKRLVRPLTAAQVVSSAEELDRITTAEPWRVQVSPRGDVVVLSRWREHLPYLAIEALWCPASRSTDALGQIRHIATEWEMTDVISPPAPAEDTAPYIDAGMHVDTLVATYRLVRGAPAGHAGLPAGCTVRTAGPSDLPVLLDIDARCFGAFWRYDRRHMDRFMALARLALAEVDGAAVGYTLCTLHGDEGLLGRLCVVPEQRRHGIGAALVRDAVAYAWDHGGRSITLSTQTDNAPSQALYRREGFRDTGRRYAFLRFGQGEE